MLGVLDRVRHYERLTSILRAGGLELVHARAGSYHDSAILLPHVGDTRRLGERPSAFGGLVGGRNRAYIAPESIYDPAKVDIRSDIYALGAVAYYFLTGEDAASGATPEEVLLKTARAEPSRPSARREGIPDSLDRLILCCLARDPGERPATVREILDRL